MKTDLLEADVGSGESNENKTAEVVLTDKVKEIEQKTNGAENKEEVAPTPAEPEVSVAKNDDNVISNIAPASEEKSVVSSSATAAGALTVASKVIDGASDLNNVVDAVGAGAKNSGKTRIGNNKKVYLPKKSGRVFQGNQFVKTKSLAAIGKSIGKGSMIGAIALGSIQVGLSLKEDGGVFGSNTAQTVGKTVGGIAGAAVGAKVLGTLGMYAGGVVGGPAGAAVGGMVGAFAGSIIGSKYGGDAVAAGVEKFWNRFR